jgi:hypothetical protein
MDSKFKNLQFSHRKRGIKFAQIYERSKTLRAKPENVDCHENRAHAFIHVQQCAGDGSLDGASSSRKRGYPEWDDELEAQLKGEWEEIAPARKQTWMQDRAAIRRGWDYDEEEMAETADR